MPTLKIIPDSDPINPREEEDNLSLMVFEHRRYSLGDKYAKSILAEKLSIIDNNFSLQELVTKAEKQGLIFYTTPVYMYDHSGVSLSTTPFSCPFDSGQIGVAIVFNDKVKEEYGVKRFTKKKKEEILEIVKRNVEGEISIYSSYVEGDVYGFQILDDDDEVIDSCYGFYGTDFETNGMKDYLPEEFKENIKNERVTYG
jgi:hypothetical protein